jgi:hypothetical protein
MNQSALNLEDLRTHTRRMIPSTRNQIKQAREVIARLEANGDEREEMILQRKHHLKNLEYRLIVFLYARRHNERAWDFWSGLPEAAAERGAA